MNHLSAFFLIFLPQLLIILASRQSEGLGYQLHLVTPPPAPLIQALTTAQALRIEPIIKQYY